MQSCHLPTLEVTIKYYVMFQIVFASLHLAVLSTGGVKCYVLKLYHPPLYYGQHDDITTKNDDISNDIMTS